MPAIQFAPGDSRAPPAAPVPLRGVPPLKLGFAGPLTVEDEEGRQRPIGTVSGIAVFTEHPYNEGGGVLTALLARDTTDGSLVLLAGHLTETICRELLRAYGRIYDAAWKAHAAAHVDGEAAPESAAAAAPAPDPFTTGLCRNLKRTLDELSRIGGDAAGDAVIAQWLQERAS